MASMLDSSNSIHSDTRCHGCSGALSSSLTSPPTSVATDGNSAEAGTPPTEVKPKELLEPKVFNRVIKDGDRGIKLPKKQQSFRHPRQNL